MEHSRQIGRVPRDQTQRAFLIQRLEPIKQLSGDLEIDIDAEPNTNQLIHLAGGSDRECARTNLGKGEVRFFPHSQSTKSTPMEFFVVLNGPNHLREVAAIFNKGEFPDSAIIRAGGCARDSDRIARKIEGRRARSRSDEAVPNGLVSIGLFLLPALEEIAALELFDVDRQNRLRLLRQPLALARRFRDQWQNDRQQSDHRNDAEIKLSKLLLVDLTREARQLRGVLLIFVHRDTMFSHLFE